MKVIINEGDPIFVNWQYDLNQQNRLVVTCNITIGQAAPVRRSVAIKITDVLLHNQTLNEIKSSARKEAFNKTVKAMPQLTKAMKVALWNAYIQSQNGNLEGKNRKVKQVIKDIAKLSAEQKEQIRNKFFEQPLENIADSKVVTMEERIVTETTSALA